MGLPSGTMWARRYVDITQPDFFAASELQYECSYFSWANVDGHNLVEGTSFGDYTWGSSTETEPYVSSPGASVVDQSMWSAANDAARQNCGAPWRLPSRADAIELFNSEYTEFIDADGHVIDPAQSSVIITIEGVSCCRLRSKVNGNILTLPCCGEGSETVVADLGTRADFFTSNLYDGTRAWIAIIDTRVSVLAGGRSYGRPIRPVFKL